MDCTHCRYSVFCLTQQLNKFVKSKKTQSASFYRHLFGSFYILHSTASKRVSSLYMISVSLLYMPFLWRREGVCLILNWASQCRSNGTDTNLTQCLTKINRMDIVHLMETSGIDPVQGHGTRTYADTEQSLALDHSEGEWLWTQSAQGTSLGIALLWSVGPGSSVGSRDRAQESPFESTGSVDAHQHSISQVAFHHQVEDLRFSWLFRRKHCGQQRLPNLPWSLGFLLMQVLSWKLRRLY